MHAKAINVGIHECHTLCMGMLSNITSSEYNKIKGGSGVLGISKFTTLVNKQIINDRVGFFDYINLKATPSCNRGPVPQHLISQGPKLFLRLFCNTLQKISPLAQSRSKLKTIFTAQLISRLLKVQN